VGRELGSVLTRELNTAEGSRYGGGSEVRFRGGPDENIGREASV
jgi:hypothetical protein